MKLVTLKTVIHKSTLRNLMKDLRSVGYTTERDACMGTAKAYNREGVCVMRAIQVSREGYWVVRAVEGLITVKTDTPRMAY